MPSPFPGMDPYIEASLRPDFHHRLATGISDQVTEQLSDQYVVEIETSVVAIDLPTSELAILFPDVQVLRTPAPERSMGGVATLEAPVTVRLPWPSTMRVPVIEIRRAGGRQLVTSIEILSPANKCGPPREQFVRKWRGLASAGVHQVAIDLLRRDEHPLPLPRFDGSPYSVAVSRAGDENVGLWPIGLRDRLPTVPLPLLAPDRDAVLDLQAAFEHVYRAARYHLSIDYSAAVPPPQVSQDEAAWLRDIVRSGEAAPIRPSGGR